MRGNQLHGRRRTSPQRSIPACAGEPPRRSAWARGTTVYPRVCGGTTRPALTRRAAVGLSPRVRGNHGGLVRRGARLGSIPACAGEPRPDPRPTSTSWVYPRVCGGTTRYRPTGMQDRGLSPRVRGNPPPPDRARIEAGSIPACAGEPAPSDTRPSASGVYPRVCGGTAARRRGPGRIEGLSPRVRGNLGLCVKDWRFVGSIPACAGEPPPTTTRRVRVWVYPRVCGGTVLVARLVDGFYGLSPRVRGNHKENKLAPDLQRSIPACAGEPSSRAGKRGRDGVYPRVCGGTYLSYLDKLLFRGLSPRVRGNLMRRFGARFRSGSIPACAGEPPRARRGRGQQRVYPRVCGGTLAGLPASLRESGLSPRVRGNRPAGGARRAGARSIPACAGEPSPATMLRSRRWVYPRVCGGTRPTGMQDRPGRGLSPRVRGNRRRRRDADCWQGSIPACAGEPVRGRMQAAVLRVYPRVCGGTKHRVIVPVVKAGLSPRVRGNQPLPAELGDAARSIPACAGEPLREFADSLARRVYPRVCGGTMVTANRDGPTAGLSPRVRGNPRPQDSHARVSGSIPACAGEPES